MAQRANKREFLLRVMCHRSLGVGLDPLLLEDDFVRDNVQVACEAVQLRLVRLAMSRGGLGYELRITPGGKLLAEGRVHEAAAAVDSGATATRIWGDAPAGALGARLYPGSPPLSMGSLSIRTWCGEVLRGIATGHLRVAEGKLHAVEVRDPVRIPGLPVLAKASAMPAPVVPEHRRQDRGGSRHVSMRRGR